MGKKSVVLFFALVSFHVYAVEYLYPIAQVGSDSTVYVLYQADVDHIELWKWNLLTKNISKALLPRFNPAGMRVLPNQRGFSFVDNGIIKVQFLDKRSPKLIKVYQPIYNINVLSWIDNDACYLSAQENERFGIYQINMRGQLHRIIYSDVCDCMYPQKIDDQLFYIKRTPDPLDSNNFSYQIVQMPYPEIVYYSYDSFNSEENLEARMAALMEEDEDNTDALLCIEDGVSIVDFGDNPIIFLHMLSANEGFVLEHSQKITKRSPAIHFTYHHIKQTEGRWASVPLFDFSIPSHMLLVDSNSRLYESILPLLPRHIRSMIYYSSSLGENYSLNMYRFNVSTGESLSISKNVAPEGCFFGPLAVGSGIFYGGSLTAHENSPRMELDEFGMLRLDLPSINF